MGRSLGSPLDGHAALKDLGRIVSEMSNMKAMMREMARSSRLKQQEEIVARNQRAREQVKHEFVMRNVAKQIDDQRAYLASQASKRHEQRQANWRKEQLKEARARREARKRASPRRGRPTSRVFPTSEPSAFMTEPPEEPPKPRPQSAAARAPETFSGGFVVPPRTCENCGRKFPSVMHLLMHDAAGCKKRRARPITPPTPPTPPTPAAAPAPAPAPAPPPFNGRKPWGFAGPRKKKASSRSPPPSEKKASSRTRHPWESTPPPKRVPDPGKRVPPKRVPPKRAAEPPPRRPTGFTFEGPRRRDPPKRPPPPAPEPSPRPVPSSPKTLYEVLGASQYASEGELRKRYRALSLTHHPDRGGDTAAMMKVNSAWDVLGDAAARRRYDASLPD